MLATKEKNQSKTSYEGGALKTAPTRFRDEGPKKGSWGRKFLILGAFLVSLIGLVSAGLIGRSLLQEKDHRARLEQEKVELLDQNEVLQRDNDRFFLQVQRLREQLKTYSVENAKIKKEIDQRYIDIANFKEQIETLEERNLALEQELKSYQVNVQPESFDEFSPEVVVAPVQEFTPVGDLPDESDLKETVERMQTEDAASQTVTTEAQTQTEGPSVPQISDAQVMTVNRKFNFVVVNRGLKHGLKIGQQLIVSREGSDIALLQVEKLYDRFAAAAISDEPTEEKVNKGDNIKF